MVIPWKALDMDEVLWYNIVEVIIVKKIEGLNNYYITKDGKVYSDVSGELKEMKQQLSDKGYYRIKLCNKTYLIHKFIALAFIDNPNNYPQINHINGIKTDNRIENLEWCTNKHNQLHAWKIGLQPIRHASNCVVTQEQADEIRLEYNKGFSQRVLAKKYGVAKTTIADILNGKYYNLNKNIVPVKQRTNVPKLTQEQADEIRLKYSQSNVSYNSLAKEYNVDHKTIKRITDNISYV